MNDYSQPEFYRFNEDSIKLVKYILSRSMKPRSILDLGAGSGVIGIELANNLKPHELFLVELQEDYRPHLEINIKEQLLDGVKASLIISSFASWSSDKKFDLIVCNPPYFLPGSGLKNHDKRKFLARTFIMDSWEILLKKISSCLSEEGRAYLVLRSDTKVLNLISKNTELCTKIVTDNKICYVELFRLNKN